MRRLRVLEANKVKRLLHWRIEVMSYCIQYPKNFKDIIEKAKLEVALEYMKPDSTVYDIGNSYLECINAYASTEITNNLYSVNTKYAIGRLKLFIDLEGNYIDWTKNFVRLDIVEEYYFRLMEKLKEMKVVSKARTVLNP
ncbi:MAG: hypothetical protein QXV69_04930 [Sulfolobaceae archaeon]